MTVIKYSQEHDGLGSKLRVGLEGMYSALGNSFFQGGKPQHKRRRRFTRHLINNQVRHIQNALDFEELEALETEDLNILGFDYNAAPLSDRSDYRGCIPSPWRHNVHNSRHREWKEQTGHKGYQC